MDIKRVCFVNHEGFGREEEANLIDCLRAVYPVILSLVAKINERVAGHILFTPVQINQKEEVICEGIPFVIVLGHLLNYPHFVFKRGKQLGIISFFEDVTDEACMIRIYDKGLMDGVSGTAFFRSEFNEAA